MNFGYVPPPIAQHIIDDCEELLLPAADRAGLDMANVWRDVMAGWAQLWIVRGSEITTAVITAMQDDDCTIWLMGGLLPDIHWLSTLERAAAGGGAKAMLIIGRTGWGRVLKGYERIEDMEGEAAFRKVLP